MIELILSAALLLNDSPTPKPVVKPAPAAMGIERDPLPMAVAVTLECTAKASGQVENCRVLGETHPGMGFGEAALALMRDAEVAPGPRDVQFARTIQFTP